MSFLEGLKESIKKNSYLWITLWCLVIINLWFIIFLNQGFYLWLTLGFVLVGVIVLWFIRRVSAPEPEKTVVLSEFDAKIDEFIEEIRPICENIFQDEVSELTRPTIDNIKSDFGTSLEWLWENTQDYLAQVEGTVNRLRLLTTPLDSLNENKSLLVGQVQNDYELMNSIVREMHRNKENNYMDLDDFLENQVSNLKNEMGKEQDLFYEYVNRLLSRLDRSKDNIDVDEYFDLEKLGQQFRVILQKALEARQMAFQDTVIRELESFSADIVGKMQKNTSQLLNAFQDAREVLDKMKQENWDATNLSMRQLNECRILVEELCEKSSEIMLTLAWQDILVEKRWQDMGERLFTIRERVQANVEEHVVGFISRRLTEEIPGLANMASSMDNVVLYKAMIDAELIYQLYKGDKFLNIIEDGVYSLLQFVRPIETVASRSIRLSEGGIRRLKMMKNEIKSGEYQPVFDKLRAVVEEYNPDLVPYLRNIYPRAFYAYSNYPYIKQRPDNLNQAAWCIFLEISQNYNYEDDVYLLAGLLLVLHQLRNKYIHPLKSIPRELENDEDIEAARSAAIKALSIMVTVEFRGLSRLSFKAK